MLRSGVQRARNFNTFHVGLTAYSHYQTQAASRVSACQSLHLGHKRNRRLPCLSLVPCRPQSTTADGHALTQTVRDFRDGSLESQRTSRSWQDLYDPRTKEVLTGATKQGQEEVYLYGYVTNYRKGRGLDFVDLVDPSQRLCIQVLCSKVKEPAIPDDALQRLGPHTPVLIIGKVTTRIRPPPDLPEGCTTFESVDQFVGAIRWLGSIEVQATKLQVLNSFPKDRNAKNDTNFASESRHLQLRTDSGLRHALLTRSQVRHRCAQLLHQEGFMEVETPLLFKSTPEGAREFIVPTRTKGLAYALPQSPQQYKQILMASGIHRYFQFARCFRDEDMRADRQPEFTQLDLELAFADSKKVMQIVEKIILEAVWHPDACQHLRAQTLADQRHFHTQSGGQSDDLVLPVYTYQDVMTQYGTDKPDPRLGAHITRVEQWIPPNLKKMLTDLQDPIVEMIKITTRDRVAAQSRQFMAAFMDLPSSIQYVKSRHGMAGISIYDPTMPLSGLASFGHEAAAQVEDLLHPEEGDIIVVLCRPNEPFAGGCTALGNMRRDLLQFAIQRDLIDPPTTDSIFWVVDFPLFSPIDEDSPGQHGAGGICSTHHPFTAPKSGQDLSRLVSEPLSIIGDHYDLVINGVEVGGGSRRIHHSAMQALIFRDVLQMKEERITDFQHLLRALEAGCPPHAGFALGFDRVMALLLGRNSVRDVIAFPKSGNGEDKFVGSPSALNAQQLITYHLQVSDDIQAENQGRLSVNA